MNTRWSERRRPVVNASLRHWVQPSRNNLPASGFPFSTDEFSAKSPEGENGRVLRFFPWAARYDCKDCCGQSKNAHGVSVKSAGKRAHRNHWIILFLKPAAGSAHGLEESKNRISGALRRIYPKRIGSGFTQDIYRARPDIVKMGRRGCPHSALVSPTRFLPRTIRGIAISRRKGYNFRVCFEKSTANQFWMDITTCGKNHWSLFITVPVEFSVSRTRCLRRARRL